MLTFAMNIRSTSSATLCSVNQHTQTHTHVYTASDNTTRGFRGFMHVMKLTNMPVPVYRDSK